MAITQRKQTQGLKIANLQGDCLKGVSDLRKDSMRLRLYTYDDLPSWYKNNENEFIRSGYRAATGTAARCFESWTYLHNETFNIYSHLLAAVSFLALLFATELLIEKRFPEASWLDRAVFAFFLFTAVVALFVSTLYHTLINHSAHVCLLWLNFDFAGIITLTFGGFISGIYVGFYCESKPRTTYWTMITFLSMLGALLVLHPKLQGKKWRGFRTLVFVCIGLSGFAPVIHGTFLYGLNRAWQSTGMPYYLLEGFFYIIGASFYASRFPESIRPGYFDIWGSSHQIFHVLVVVATFVHFTGIWHAFAYHYEHNRTCTVRV